MFILLAVLMFSRQKGECGSVNEDLSIPFPKGFQRQAKDTWTWKDVSHVRAEVRSTSDNTHTLSSVDTFEREVGIRKIKESSGIF